MISPAELSARLSREAEEVTSRLRERFHIYKGASPRLEEAMLYSLLAGGKRLRPVLCLWTYDAHRPHRGEAVWNAALALEMLHTYSLIHDDLPAMDDDDLRRGKPSNHRRFDEATAILAGDALQTEAFATLSEIDPPDLARECVRRLTKAVGRFGMAAGQQWDIDSTGSTGVTEAPTDEQLTRIHRLKTGALLGVSFSLGAACAGLPKNEIDAAEEAGMELGIAFQIVDDLLDESSNAGVLGKSSGKDAQQGKLTAPSVLGEEGSRQRAEELMERASGRLSAAGIWSDSLEGLCRLLVHRER